jgi:phage/plasmid-like protein (TIGR03299 family)
MLDMTNDRANIAFLGSRKDVWHRLGQEMLPGMSMDEWRKQAGLDWQAIIVPAMADLTHLGLPNAERGNFVVRSDNGVPLGYVSDRYQPVQPADVLAWFEQYISVDDRFEIDVAGSLKQGEIIWATAKYNGGIKVAGADHVARLLMTTTFDGSGATINQATMTNVVCLNTLKASLCDTRAIIKTRHNTKFNPERVGNELSQIASGFETFKRMGDAMAATHFAKDETRNFFKKLLDIPFDAKSEDVSTRKLNQYNELKDAYRTTAGETEPETAWCALNAVTRYVDHDRSTRGGSNQDEARFLSAQFGSGAAMKAQAVELLTSNEDFKAIMAQPFIPASRDPDADIKAMLASPFKPRMS